MEEEDSPAADLVAAVAARSSEATRRKMKLLKGLCVLLLCGFASAQTLTSPESARVDEVFAPYARTDSPGCALGVYRNGSMIYEHGYGMASLELSVPITPETVFDIGSTSKQFPVDGGALQHRRRSQVL